MAKVIKKGNTFDWSKDVTCSDCDSVIRFFVHDLVRETVGWDTRGGEPWDHVMGTCPVCKRYLKIAETKELPKPVRKRLRNPNVY